MNFSNDSTLFVLFSQERRGGQSRYPGTPLLALHFHRCVIDEVQTVENQGSKVIVHFGFVVVFSRLIKKKIS